MNNRTVPITWGRQNLYAIADEVQKPGHYYNFTINGVRKVVAMSADEFDSWLETMEVVRDFPNLARETLIAHKEYVNGNYITLGEYLAKSKPKVIASKNALRSRHPKKNSKRT